MPLLKGRPREDHSLVLRTDYSDDAAWDAVCREIREPVGEFRAYVDCLSDREYDGMTAEQLTALLAPDVENTFLVVVDGETLSHPEHPVLVVDLYGEPGRTFRIIPSEAWGSRTTSPSRTGVSRSSRSPWTRTASSAAFRKLEPRGGKPATLLDFE